jgi:release factor glutamine methyltransferase
MMPPARGSTVREALAAATATLAAAGVDTARVDAEWLLADVLGTGRMALGLAPVELSPVETERFRVMVCRRAAREPLQRLLGWEAFHGLRLAVTDDVLVPRPETEMLAAWVLELLPPPRPGRRPRVLDLGTGSGCIACAVARARPDTTVIALDVSVAAAAVARANACALEVEGRVRVVAGDLLAPLRERVTDLIVSNPPYLPSAWLADLPPEVCRHEPRLALEGGPDGLAVIRRIVEAAQVSLREGGGLLLETAGGDQLDVVAALLRDAGFGAVTARSDLAGVRRFVAARRGSARPVPAGSPGLGRGREPREQGTAATRGPERPGVTG